MDILGTSTPNRNSDSVCPMKVEYLYSGFGILLCKQDILILSKLNNFWLELNQQ